MYQYGLTFGIYLICTVTDVRQRLIGKRILGVYAASAFLGHEIMGTCTMGGIVAGMIPGMICLMLSRISREALGYGDSLLILATGISLGLMRCTELLIWAFLFSGLWALILLVCKRSSRKRELPFVPFLMLGFWIMAAG